MPKTRSFVAIAATVLLISACDLPTNADEARDYLRERQEERIIPVHLPMPELSVTLAEQLAELSGIVDTTDLTFRIDPDTFAVGLDSLLELDPIDPDPVTQGYELAIQDFVRSETVEVPGLPVSLPGPPSQSTPLPVVSQAGSVTIPVTLDAFTSATFDAGSALRVILSTGAGASVDGVQAHLEDGSGTTLAVSGAPIAVPSSTTDTLVIDLAGATLPASFDLVVSFAAGQGTGTTDDLAISSEFAGTALTAATGVDATIVEPVAFTDTIPLDATGADFSEATLAAGSVAVTDYSLGTLELTTAFTPADLAGLRVGGPDPDSLVITGQVGPPAGAATVDIVTPAEVTVAFTDLAAASVTLTTLEMVIDQAVPVPADTTLDSLERVEIETGTLEVAVINRLGVGGPVELVLTGLTDSGGLVITETFELQPSPDGTPTATTVSVDLAGTTLTPSALEPSVTGVIGGTDVTVTAEAAAEAVTVDPYLEIHAREVVLAGIPDVDVTVDERISVASADVELGELADLIDRIDFNDVTVSLTIRNGTGLDLALSDLGVTLLESGGQPVVESGDTARVSLSGTGSAALTAPADAETRVTESAASFVNALLDRVAAGQDLEVATTGTAAPASDSGAVAVGDSVSVVFEIVIGPDITLDPSGITLDRTVAEALSLDSLAADLMADLREDLVSAAVEFEVINGLPLGLGLTLALAPTPADTAGFDPFQTAGGVILESFGIEPATTDTEGRVTAPVTSISEVAIQPADLDVLQEGDIGMGIEAIIIGPAGDRARLSPTDSLVIRPLLKLEIRVGAEGGTN